MEQVGKIIDGLAIPVMAVNANLQVLAMNTLAKQAFTDLSEGGRFAGFMARIDGLEALLKDTLTSGQTTATKVKSKAGFRSDYIVTMKNIGALQGVDSPVLLMTFDDRSLFNDMKTMRTGFVANVSHEIRSPLTAISGLVETLQGLAIEDVAVRTRFLGLMAKEVTRMTNLVSDLLSLSQVEAKERRALKHRIDPEMVIDQAVESVATIAAKWGKMVIVDVDENLPAVMGRHDDLIRVLINLLENAIHYSRQDGEVHLRASIDHGKNLLDQDAIMIRVTDDGEGIAADEIPFLTQRFYRVDKSRSRNMGGTGLGLAIVKHILVRHRGELLIESTLGQGASFSIYLPIAPASVPGEKTDLS